MKRALRAVLLIAVVAGCSAPVSQASFQPTDQATTDPGASSAPVPTPSSSAAPSTTPNATPTTAPAPTPTTAPTPKPSPTLNWAANGCSASVRDPVELGKQAQVTLKCPVGPTCTLKLTYPSGSAATLPAPTHPQAGWWRWTWTVPRSAHAGTATGTSTCTYAGDPHVGSIDFKLEDAALPGGYSINVLNPAPRAWNDTGYLWMTVKVQGTVPSSPGHGVTLTCQISVWSYNGLWVVSAYTSQFDYVNGSGQFDVAFTLDPAMTVDWIGTSTWTVKCRNVNVSTDTWKQDTGTIEITS